MRKKLIAIASVLFLAAAGMVAAFFLFGQAPRRTGPLRHEVYVWQRAWTHPVLEAVAQHGSNFAALAVLKAEISWKNQRPQLVRANVDYATLAMTKRPVGLALRIGPYPGPFAPPLPPTAAAVTPATNGPAAAAITAYLCNVAAGLVAEARTNSVALAELQIDFDCAESKLDGYRVWVEAIQRRVAPVPVTITALPSWLNARAFKRLVASATNYVLQVHSVSRPKSIEAPFTLCDPDAARRAVERAGRIGVPFRVALPTYGYVLAFAPDGQFLGLSAEGPRPNWPADVRVREVHSDETELSALLQDWTASRPAALQGVIWYRLPTTVDNFNWRWPTLAAMLNARVPQEKFSVRARRVESGLVEISLANTGELDVSSRLAVVVRWPQGRLVASDALRGFELTERRNTTAQFQTKSQPVRLRAGDQFVIGWLRFDADCEVQCELKKM